MQNASSLPLLPGSLWPGELSPDRVQSMGQIELNCLLRQNCIALNRTILIIKLCTLAKLNYLK